jgi:starch-binding outer membrane protein, SusD/RagB family
MKKIFLILSTILIIFTACDDMIDLNPYDGLTDEQLFSTPSGFTDAIRGAYAGFIADGLYGENTGIHISPEVMSDNVITKMDGRGTLRALYEYRISPSTESYGLYFRGYRVISRANRIIDNIYRLPESDFRDNIEGEALALRGLLHFEIARVYCKIPTQSADANTSMGIYYSKTYEPDKYYRRVDTNVASVYTEAIKDLEDAYALIGSTNPDGRLNKRAVAGLLSRVYLHAGNYTKTIEWAQEAITLGAAVTPRESFAGIWTDTYTTSVLFRIKILDPDKWRIGVPYNQVLTAGIRSEFVPDYSLYTLYQTSDIRTTTTMVTSQYGGVLYNHVTKYQQRPGSNSTVVDGKFLRAEEVFLNLAEALYNNSQESTALSYLNLLREQRYSGFVSPDEAGTALYDAIHLERRLELAFEGDRFFTLKRLGLNLSRGDFGDIFDGSGTKPVVMSYAASNPRWQLPIPQAAIDNNPLMTDEDQNPGY